MKTQNGKDVTPPHPCGQKSTFTLRGRSKDGLIQGKLRIRSIPGAFLVLGVIVVVVGTALAVAGYWPYRLQRASILGPTDGKYFSESQTSGSSLEGKPAKLSTARLFHSARIKLLGPVIMGVGLFILICANTILYENRDRETQMLLAQMRTVICSVSATVPSAELKESAAPNSMAEPAAHLSILQELSSSEPLLVTRHPRDQEHIVEGIYQQGVLQTEALDQKSEPLLSLHSCYSNSCNSSQEDFYTQSGAEHGGSFNSLRPPHVKFNSCLVSASSLFTLDELDIPAIQPRRCHSMSYRTNLYRAGTVVPDGHHKIEEIHINQVVLTGETGSQVCVDKVVETAEEQTCQSWPRLDLITGS
ncbi:transmembrane protein 200A [Pungitius pungitius]|uniref:transmembrane protein 200A n=1 Tax=Pungitius pungitius TaxID=134920 RepID=UPI002E0D98DE